MSATKHKILGELNQRRNDYEAKLAYRGVSLANRLVYKTSIQEIQSMVTWIEDNVKEEQGR